MNSIWLFIFLIGTLSCLSFGIVYAFAVKEYIVAISTIGLLTTICSFYLGYYIGEKQHYQEY
jgi:spore maturation protein SpmA